MGAPFPPILSFCFLWIKFGSSDTTATKFDFDYSKEKVQACAKGWFQGESGFQSDH